MASDANTSHSLRGCGRRPKINSAKTPPTQIALTAALNQSANQNIYFIELQERISAESRNYSAISNVLKARHDTVKNAIGNIR